MPIALQIQLDELPTACLELGQGGAVEMGGNARKQGVALNEGRVKAESKVVLNNLPWLFQLGNS